MAVQQEHRDPKTLRERIIKRTQWTVMLIVALLVILVLFVEEAPFRAGTDGIDSRGGEVRIDHDEVIMMLISLIVFIEIFTSLKLIRFIPQKGILLSSFLVFTVSAVSTVVEGYVFSDVLNYIEHSSLMASAILLAVWCGRVFQAREREDA